jgi:hypothetical protein
MEKRLLADAEKKGYALCEEDIHEEICLLADLIISEARQNQMNFPPVLKYWGNIFSSISSFMTVEQIDGKALSPALGLVAKRGQEIGFFQGQALA